jgi:hypothetical protein
MATGQVGHQLNQRLQGSHGSSVWCWTKKAEDKQPTGQKQHVKNIMGVLQKNTLRHLDLMRERLSFLAAWALSISMQLWGASTSPSMQVKNGGCVTTDELEAWSLLRQWWIAGEWWRRRRDRHRWGLGGQEVIDGGRGGAATCLRGAAPPPHVVAARALRILWWRRVPATRASRGCLQISL